MGPMASPVRVSKRASRNCSPSGTSRLIVDLPIEDRLRFKAICALHRTTALREVSLFLAAQIAQPDRLLSRTFDTANVREQ